MTYFSLNLNSISIMIPQEFFKGSGCTIGHGDNIKARLLVLGALTNSKLPVRTRG